VIPRRERAAFDGFVTSSSNRLLRTAYLLCGDRGHAEDLVQTALMRTARRWRQAREAPEAYARRVLVNLAKDRHRQLRRRPREASLEIDVIDRAAPASATDHDELMQAFRRLPDGQRAVLALRFFDDLSVSETAAALGCSAGTVKSQTSRALLSLRSALAPTKETTHAH
jgi:RNA polymerase sigma-70 factor (sigma-E family)